MKKMMRQVRNVWDGKYTIIGSADDKAEREPRAAGGLRETDSRVVKKLLDVGLAFPQAQTDEARSKR